MDIKGYQKHHIQQIEHMLNFLAARAKGDIPTGAKFIRDIITNNEFYKQDSKISSDLISILTKQILNLHKQQNFCACERNTNVDSAEFNKLEETKEEVKNDSNSSGSLFNE